MPSKKRRRIKKKPRKKRHLIFILFLIAVGVFFLFEEFGNERSPGRIFDIFSAGKRHSVPAKKFPPHDKIPRVSIIMDDLGSSKEKVRRILGIDSPLTISILPLEKYSRWTAEKAHELGRDIILHLPMEATRPFKLGEGGLYLWMTDEDIVKTVRQDIDSIPYVNGVSNHMGSAFTEDKRAMKTVVTELKRHGLFFLDSMTTAKSAGYNVARSQGLKALRRDVFLDNTDTMEQIKLQWERFIKIAHKEGYAIALAHPRENTLDFLKKKLMDNHEVHVVPISELVSEAD